MKAVEYRRVSTDDQFDAASGLNAQHDSCVGWASAHKITLIGPFDEDGGLSGSTPLDKCPALMDAMAILEKGDVLVVAKRDRIARDRLKIALLEQLLKSKGCKLVSAAGEGTDVDDPDDPMAFMVRGMVDLFAEFERIQVKWRTRMSLAAKKRRGERTGQIPYGVRLGKDDGRRSRIRKDGKGGNPIAVEADPAEIRTIRYICLMRRDGHSIGKIAQQLDQWSIPTKNGGAWSRSSVHAILAKHLPGFFQQ